MDIHPELFTMVQDCWSEMPLERPKIDDIRELLYKRSGGNKSTNLMDHVIFYELINYSNLLLLDVCFNGKLSFGIGTRR